MFRLYDFKCTSEHITEELVDADVREIPCPDCGQPAQRVQSPIAFRLPPTGFPGAAHKWAKAHEKAGKPNRDGTR